MASLLLAVIYLAFISLGLPDSLLGSAWPAMVSSLAVPVSWAGGIFSTISLCTVGSALLSDRLTERFGADRVTAVSVAVTALAMFGFSLSRSYVMLVVWAVPYGLGAGSIDAALNNYVALHYSSRHMSWLHGMWGIGTTIGPALMSQALTNGTWRDGYRTIALIQCLITMVIVISLPLWKKQTVLESKEEAVPSFLDRRLKTLLTIPGALNVFLTFFAYCALEQTANLWASSYLALTGGVSEKTAAGYASLFFIGITVGRFLSGVLSPRFGDAGMVRLGQGITAVGILLLVLPGSLLLSLAGLVIIGLGSAPVYPSLIHATPTYFGTGRSQAMIGLQMAFAYVGTTLMPPLFGFLAKGLGFHLFPIYLTLLLLLMICMHERLLKKTASV